MTDSIWEKLHEHDRTMRDIQVKQALQEERLDAHDRRIDKNQRMLVDYLERIENKMDVTTKWMHETRGAAFLFKWIAATALGVGTLYLAWIKFFAV